MGTDETAVDAAAVSGFWHASASRMVEFHVSGLPVPQGSMRSFIVGKGKNARPVITSSSKGLPQWRQMVALRAQEVAGKTFEGPVSVRLEFLLPKPKSAPKRRRIYATKRPDLDKLIRSVLDSITHVLIEDDSQVVEITAVKDYGPPGVHVTISAIE